MGSPVLVLQPDDAAPVGRLAEWLVDAGADLTIRRIPDDPVPADLDGYSALIVLGGAMSVAEDADHPWLSEIRTLLSAAVAKDLPVLAICLGAQLLAQATGGQVGPGAEGPESGLRLVAKRDAAEDDQLFGPLPMTPDVVQSHFDEISLLPPRAVLLAASPVYQHQAFRLGRAYGLLFHIETTPDIFRRWIGEDVLRGARVPERQFDPEFIAEAHAELAEIWRPFAQRFVRLITAGPGLAGRQLPVVNP
ncbi:type 1 glutamine amidotransferase [Pseudonocardiaceae bacterium YIM PH 21723]|nr:type 1 glutamine amidotransferase [Pseudonocardiaceae bacterium YIM PH 21723]